MNPAQKPILIGAPLDVLAGIRYFRGEGRPRPPHWTTTLADPPRDGAIRPAIRGLAARQTGVDV